MWKVEKRFHVRLGGNTYVNVPNLISYKGQPLFTFKRHEETEYLGIYFDIYDAQGRHSAAVKRNEIYFGDKDKYKIDGSHNRYIFSERDSNRVICDIKKREDAHPAELEVAVNLYTPSGFFLEATPEQTNLGGIVMIDNLIMDCPNGILIN